MRWESESEKVTSPCEACDSFNPNEDCDELLHGVELHVVVDQAHPSSMVTMAYLKAVITIMMVKMMKMVMMMMMTMVVAYSKLYAAVSW